MAEDSELARILRLYTGPEADPGPDEVYSTAVERYDPFAAFPGTPSDTHWDERLRDAQSERNAGRRATNPISSALRTAAHYIPAYDDPEMRRGDTEGWAEWWARTNHQGSLPNFLMQAAKGGLNSSANWLDWKPKVGPDTLNPLGAGAAIGLAGAGRGAAARSGITPGDWAHAKWIERRLDQMEGGPNPSWDRGITGGSDPHSAYTVPRSAEALRRDYDLHGAPPSNVVPFGLRRPANVNAKNDLSNVPGILVNAAEQRPTAGRTPLSERQAALERGKRGLYELEEPDFGIGHFPEGPRYNPEHTFYAHSALKDAGHNWDAALRSMERYPAVRDILQAWADAGIDPVRAKKYWRAQSDLHELEPPTRALRGDEKGEFVRPSKLNAHPSSSLPGAFATQQQSLQDILAQYGNQF